jgi:hypothetical protein
MRIQPHSATTVRFDGNDITWNELRPADLQILIGGVLFSTNGGQIMFLDPQMVLHVIIGATDTYKFRMQPSRDGNTGYLQPVWLAACKKLKSPTFLLFCWLIFMYILCDPWVVQLHNSFPLNNAIKGCVLMRRRGFDPFQKNK